jgi:hypothetical protein
MLGYPTFAPQHSPTETPAIKPSRIGVRTGGRENRCSLMLYSGVRRQKSDALMPEPSAEGKGGCFQESGDRVGTESPGKAKGVNL